MTDMAFLGIIKGASANGTYFFTRNQLYVSALKHFKKKSARAWIAIVIFSVLGLAVLIAGIWLNPVLLVVAAGLLFLTYCLWKFRITDFPKETWNKVVPVWTGAGKPIDQLITEPTLGTPPPDWEEKDIYDYGVEGVLICDKKRYVDLFVLNHFHTQNKMAVLSVDGYPDYLLPRVNELLENRQDLPVYLVHDAHGKKGMMKKRILRNGLIKLGSHPVRDLGLFAENLEGIEFLKAAKFGSAEQVPLDAFVPKLLMNSVALSIVEGAFLGALLNDTLASKRDSDGGSYG